MVFQVARPNGRGAVIEATRSRFRPVMLTAILTVLGFISIGRDLLRGPMAFAIMGGLEARADAATPALAAPAASQ